MRSAAEIWTSGLFWRNGDGVETLVAVTGTSKVIVLMRQCEPKYNYKLLTHRSTLINLVRELQHEICPSIHCEEYFIHPSDVTQCIETVQVEASNLVPMNEVCEAINAGQCFVIEYNCKVQDVILFDPYYLLCQNIVEIIMNREHRQQKIPKIFYEYLTDHLYSVRQEIFIRLFGLSVTSLSRVLASEPEERFLNMLMRWNNNSRGTFGDLKCAFDSISLFQCVKNSGNNKTVVGGGHYSLDWTSYWTNLQRTFFNFLI